MPKTLAAEPSLNPALLAFKPRQLLISRPVMGKESKTSTTLESDQKLLLLRSIAQYLDRCGFSKCFKKFLSEAEIEKKELNATLPNLEEIYNEFLKKEHEAAVKGITVANVTEGVENVKQEKKKKKETKVAVTEDENEKVKETDTEINDGLKEKKKKKKKKNKSKSIEAESLGDDGEEGKTSKKRKRVEPEEIKEETKDDFEESKRRKKEENAVDDEESVPETPVKKIDIQANGNVEKRETKSTNHKSGKGLSNSKEPKKPFQRVNVEEVVFTDDRLKDNSYWAKDGADIGYGAKAQEVLGQVRGRGFRHEKTKKKRGSYRGGEIDLQSHSVKFDYSEEE